MKEKDVIQFPEFLVTHVYTRKYLAMHMQTCPEVNISPVSDMLSDSKSLIAVHRYFLAEEF